MISHTESLMQRETNAAPSAVRALFATSGAAIDALASRLQALPVRTAVTVARGSSDHAASHFAYLLLTRLGVPVTSLPPSAITLHHAPIDATGMAAVAFSQSGQSPDLSTAMAALRARGAVTVALVNDVSAPLAMAAEYCINLAAGPEKSIAATKSFIAQLAASTRLVASWSRDAALLEALEALPDALEQALAADWSAAINPLIGADRMLVIARGASLAIAAEMALKLKEVCAIQAEAFSVAEVKHGPMALIGAGYRLLMLAPRGPEQPEVLAFAADMRRQGASVLIAAPEGHRAAQLPIAAVAHDVLDGVSAVQSFYVMV